MSDDTARCECACHDNPGATCTIDTGSSGVPGLTSCSPCAGVPTCVLGCGNRLHVGVLCRRHYHQIDQQLDQIVELYALLPEFAIGGGGGDGRSATKVYTDAPGNLDIMSLTDRRAAPNIPRKLLEPDDQFIPDIPGTLASWASLVADARDRQPDGYDPTVTEAVRMLHKHRHWLASQDELVADYVEDLGLVHQWLARVTKAGLWPKPMGHCPNCRSALYRTIGVDLVKCTKCKTNWSGAVLARKWLMEEEARKP